MGDWNYYDQPKEETSMSILCLYNDDLDGRCAASIVSYYYGWRVRLLEISRYSSTRSWNLLKSMRDESKAYNKKFIIYMVNCSISPDEMFDIDKIADEFHWIAPWSNTMNIINGMDKHHSINYHTDKHRKRMGSCELAWEYFYPNEEVPHPILLLGRCISNAEDIDIPEFSKEFYVGMESLEDETTPDNILFWSNLIEEGPDPEEGKWIPQKEESALVVERGDAVLWKWGQEYKLHGSNTD